MAYEHDRRTSARHTEDCSIYFFGEGSQGTWQLRGVVSDVSGEGLGFRSQHKWDVGTILWCAVPSKAIYSRAMVCHCTGRPWDRKTGVRFLAGPLARD
ncbi:PilZ domain-containing protein [Paludibaculum fermentans]|uniref:PilZ domain-containing protein n=1 Tax=Paludibaculum fermentans TaxID=1473598 RepID=A0A7S7SH80_PALFE|nr:PilZ domain-containing protein [Paludibaculum fermentans]QOY85642.1 PilZ domain-containing protein [Paludibaculum fermentans]